MIRALRELFRSFALLSREERSLLRLLGLTFLVNQYDMALLGLALPQIQAELGVPEAGVGPLISVVRIGVLLSLPLALAADRVGRRRLLLLTLLGFSFFTTGTAFAQTPQQFAGLQLCARAFISAEEVIAIVLVAEQTNARARGLGFGILAIYGALGHGVAAISYGFIESVPFGWRSLYAAAVLPLLALAWIRRSLRESERFEAQRAARAETPVSLLAPIRELLAEYPARLFSVLGAIFAFGFVAPPALAFVSKTLQGMHGWSPAQVSTLIVTGGSVVLISYPLAGWLSDQLGRRRVLVAAMLVNAAGIVAFFNASGFALVPAWLLMLVGFMAADVLFGAVGTELFPTAQRATASALRMLAFGAGGALGLAVEGLLLPLAGEHARAITWMAAGALVAPCIVLLAFPETAVRELEEIAPAPAWSARPEGDPRCDTEA